MATQADIMLEAPEPISAIATDNAAGLVALTPEQMNRLNARASQFVAELSVLNPNAPEFGRMAEQLSTMGRKEIADAAGHSNRFLDRPARAINQETGVGADLAQLRRTIEDLDPAKQGNLLKPKKLFGLIPFGDKLRDYFDSYTSAEGHISALLLRLASGKDELLKDNAAIDVERQNLWAAIDRLEHMIYAAKALDKRLEAKSASLELSDPAKSRAIREQALFYIRQRMQDLLTQMAVSVQGYLALDLVKKNNIELVKGVDRASATTVAALRTAVTVASALTQQQLVLEQISALNSATASIIDSSGELLRTNSARIYENAASATVPLATLQQAFENIYFTMDQIDMFKTKALASMKSTADALSNEVEKSKSPVRFGEVQTALALTRDEPDPFSAI